MTGPRSASDPDAIAEAVLPLDGPYHPDQLARAADVITALARRLAHATLPHNTAAALPTPAALDAVLKYLEPGMTSLPQALRQLAGHLRRGADDQSLRADEDTDPRLTAPAVALLAAEHLAAAAGHGSELARALDQAHNCTARLYADRRRPAP
ncbi:MAG: hypothetical protein V7603_5115 [Micromonosporaceae bacterium]